ncbi:sigma-70 family RNA polymerase sigma factor [Clostridium culturomicium]|uniref:sigma-70 family RNA polymerase sigma factor n=1 Tax=Clostridium culturomicium TaxID=1499683 RepID=UPI003857B260
MNYQESNEEQFMKQLYDDLEELVSNDLSLSQMDNEELLKSYQNGNKEALDMLIANNTGIINKLVNKYKFLCYRGLTEADLFQEGTLGLIKAANMYKFDLENKAKFITYAVHYINRYICSCINGHSDKDIQNRKFYNSCKSLNVPLSDEDNGVELGEFIEDKENKFADIIEKEFIKIIRKELDEVMKDKLTLKEREVIKLIYGWDYGKSKEFEIMTLEEVGDILGVTRERIRQIKSNAFMKIRNSGWWKTKGKYYVHEIKGLIFISNKDSEISYRQVEKGSYSSDDLQGHDFINKYFADLMEEIS